MKPIRQTPPVARTDVDRTPTRIPADSSRRSRPGKRRVRTTATDNLIGMAATQDRLSTFTAAVRTAGLEGLLAQDGPFTIFAPTNRAFQSLPQSELAALLADQSRLARVLCHHVVPGRVKAPRPDAPGMVLPVAGEELALTAGADVFHVDEARLVKTNIRATNGVIHAIDAVLMIR